MLVLFALLESAILSQREKGQYRCNTDDGDESLFKGGDVGSPRYSKIGGNEDGKVGGKYYAPEDSRQKTEEGAEDSPSEQFTSTALYSP